MEKTSDPREETSGSRGETSDPRGETSDPRGETSDPSGQYFMQVCVAGVNYALTLQRSLMRRRNQTHGENGCNPYGSEKDKHGNQVFESKWCDENGRPMKSLCVADHGARDERAKYCGEGDGVERRRARLRRNV